MKEQKGNETKQTNKHYILQTCGVSITVILMRYTAVVSVTNKYSLLVVFLCLALEVHGVSVSVHIWGNVSTSVMSSSPPLPLRSTSLMFPRHPSRSGKRCSWPERNDRLLESHNRSHPDSDESRERERRLKWHGNWWLQCWETFIIILG